MTTGHNISKLKYGCILDPEDFCLQFLDSWCGIAYSFCPAKQIINPKHVPTCPQGHFSVKSSLYNIHNFQWKSMPPTLKNSIELFKWTEKIQKYGKLLPIYSRNGLQNLLSHLPLAPTKWIFEVGRLWAPFGLFQGSNCKIWLELISQTMTPTTMGFGSPSKIVLRILNHLSNLCISYNHKITRIHCSNCIL